jgi:hypothetical protein
MTETTARLREVSPSVEHLRARLGLIHERVRAAVDRRRAGDPAPSDPFRGLYVSEGQVDAILRNGHGAALDVPTLYPSALDRIETAADLAEMAGESLRLRNLAGTFGLDQVDVDLLLVALAPDLDPRAERLYGYLHDDVSRRRASIGLAFELTSLEVDDGVARARLTADGSLVAGGLVAVGESDRPFLSRTLRVPDRVVAHLLDGDAVAHEVERVLDGATMPAWSGRSETLERALSTGLHPVYLREAGTASGATTAAAAAAWLRAPVLSIDLRLLGEEPNPIEVVDKVILEARLAHALVVAGPIEALAERHPATIRRLAESPSPAVLFGSRGWDAAWSLEPPLQLDAPRLSPVERGEAWFEALAWGPWAGMAEGRVEELAGSVEAFRLKASQIAGAAEAGRRRARAEDRRLEISDIQFGARAQNASGLERLAHRIEPAAGWSDLVLPEDVGAQLQELAGRARHRELVAAAFMRGTRASRGNGITALFAGESGTGKTLAAEAIAAELGLDLYVVDLSTVIDKYIGETEKNLDRIFTEADRVNAVLLFDEADAIFGKRSEVRDARDRYANVEVAYLLQRMERFDGLAVLTTNLRSNLDESFTRRIDVIVDFPVPDEVSRRALWEMHLSSRVRQDDDIDLNFAARQFHLAGGNIRNICLTAAFLAADDDEPVAMRHLIRATDREYRKLGRLTLEAEFGPYLAILGRSVTGARS